MGNLDMKIENICESPVRSKPKSLIAVVTEGCEPVQCYSIGERLKTVSVDVPRLPQAAVKDTIGAGDSFIAGFIYVLLREGSLRSCIEYAIWTAQKMIQQVGVTLFLFLIFFYYQVLVPLFLFKKKNHYQVGVTLFLFFEKIHYQVGVTLFLIILIFFIIRLG